VSIDLGMMYRTVRERIAAVVSDDVAATRVPATPLWDVHDVVAHLAGVVEDALHGNMDGVTTDPWTAAQVQRGAAKPVSQMLSEWSAGAPLVESVLSAPGSSADRAVYDICTHEADLRHALGLAPLVDDPIVEWVGGELLAEFIADCVAADLEPVPIKTTPFEVMRSRLGRRTIAEAVAIGVPDGSGEYLDRWFVFGRASASLAEV
jgi:uncharacterized protein (TIGR03083 family)